MQDNNIYTKEEEIKTIKVGRPHVVLLGAGASRASFPSGDKNGTKLPVMNDLIEILNLKQIFKEYSIEINSKNFEEVFSDLYEKDKQHPLVNLVEEKIINFFSKLEIPDHPTIYDYLLLSLRGKDVVASFNWDPLLWLAAQRNYGVVKLPHIIFLHGNVKIGYCHNCKVKGENGYNCPKCGNTYTPSSLLYPIKQKNYNMNPGIESEWTTLKKAMNNAYIFTVFGYSAPKTDVEAMDMLKEAWGGSNKRNMEQTEFIHKPGANGDSVMAPWSDFIHSHHHEPPTDNFFESTMGKHPRRTCDAMFTTLMDVKFVDENPAPQNVTLYELQQWHQKLAEYEK